MKFWIYSSVLALLALLSLPTSSDAWSRRSSSSEVGPTQALTAPVNGYSNDVSAQAVPEPPVLLLMSVGLGVYALYSAMRAYRRQC